MCLGLKMVAVRSFNSTRYRGLYFPSVIRPVGSNYRITDWGGGTHYRLWGGGGGGGHTIFFFLLFFFFLGGGGGIFVQLFGGGGHSPPCPPYSYGPGYSTTNNIS